MAGVDDKIVSMQFDNKGFQAKIAETLQSLDKLKTGLDMSHATRGMQEVSAAAGRFSLGNMVSQVSGVSAGFVALGAVAVTALANITNRAIDAGLAFARSITVAPIMQGFEEFELKMGSIQTIMAGSGASLETVNRKLQELNAYSDRTIYSFADMTQNIGKFTNAGVSLDDSVAAIQGVANVAALAGANSGEASRSMYNFAQAISTGSVKLIDWKSIELANMGTVEFKQQLIDTGVAMGTLTKRGDEYITSAGTAMSATKGFNQSLTDEWLSAEVLTDTLTKFSDETTDIGKRATAAATEIKTFSMMIDTMKESVGSGWGQTFETVIGDFEEGKALWTEINAGFESVIGASAEARNKLLRDWKDLGGREALLDGFRNAIKGIGSVLAPIKEAFRDIFPPMTAERLMSMTEAFTRFTEKLIISGETADKIKSIFSGVFSVLKIGWEVIKGVAGVFGDLIGSIAGSSGGVLTFAAGIGDTVTKFQEMLVEGGAIKRFFENISEAIQQPGKYIAILQEKLEGAFQNIPGGEILLSILDRLRDRFDMLRGAVNKVSDIWGAIAQSLSGFREILADVLEEITTWFSELGQEVAQAMKPSDFDGAVDAVGIGLLGGIGLMLKKFFQNGFNLDFLTGGVFENIKDSLDAVTGSLRAMQADLRAKALMKIAAAMALLTVSIVALSLINSAALVKALTAIGVGFGILIGAMLAIEKANMGLSAIKMSGFATAMILMAGAMAILSIAVKNLSSLGWEELAKGLIGVGVSMAIMIAGMNLLTTNTSGLVRAGIAMVAMSVGLIALSYAVKSFSDLSWAEMAKGMVGVAVGLGLLAGAMRLMPVGGMIGAGIGMVAISGGLLLLAEAVERFAGISWGDMAKGFVGIGVGLGIIAGAMHLMPRNLPITAAGMVVLSGALIVLTTAVKMLGGTPLGELAKGLGALAIMLGVLAVAMIAMTGTAAGAAATVVAAGALVILTGVLKTLGGMSLGELAMGLGAIAAVLGVLGLGAYLLAPLVPVLMSLGTALLVIGIAFAAFGVGAALVAKAFEIMARAGKVGVQVLIESIGLLLAALPGFVGAFVTALMELVTGILGAIPSLVGAFVEVIAAIIDGVILLVPKFAELATVIITTFLTAVQERFPMVVETGILIITTILTAIRDNIFQFVTLGVEILTNFIAGIVQNMVTIVDAVVTLITTFIGALAARAAEIVAAGLALLVSLISGVTANLGKVTDAVAQLIITFLAEVTASLGRIIAAGVEMLVKLLSGISSNLSKVIDAVAEVITTFINDLGARAGDIIKAGLGVLEDLLQGIGDNLSKVINTAGDVVSEFITEIGANATKIATAGADALIDFLDGIGDNISRVLEKGVEVAIEFIQGVGDSSERLARAGLIALIDFLNGLENAIRANSGRLRSAGIGVAAAIIDGITGGLASRAGDVINAVVGIGQRAIGGLMSAIGANSPAKEFIKIAGYMADGLVVGLDRDRGAERSAANLGDRAASTFQKTISKIPESLGDMRDFNPTITPVLDLSKVKVGARGLNDMMAVQAIAPTVSFDRAREISTTAEVVGDDTSTPAPSAPSEVTFEQNIYAPSALSTNDIYRSTKSQIALAKEELNI